MRRVWLPRGEVDATVGEVDAASASTTSNPSKCEFTSISYDTLQRFFRLEISWCLKVKVRKFLISTFDYSPEFLTLEMVVLTILFLFALIVCPVQVGSDSPHSFVDVLHSYIHLM